MNKETIILECLYKTPEASQRELARAGGISLGQTNIIIKKFCDDGLIRREALSKRTTKYILTQRGIAERALRSNEQILLILRDYRRVKGAIVKLLHELYGKGFREFVLEGEPDGLHEVINSVFNANFKGRASLTWGPSAGRNDQIVLNLDRRFSGASKNVVHVLHEIAL